MIDLIEFSKADHRTRLACMKNDLRYAVAIHEAGHVTMGQLNGIASEVRLPELAAGYRFITTNADAIFKVGGLSKTAITEICLGGYLAELAIFGPSEQVYVHADRAANDCVALIGRLRPADFGALSSKLLSGGEAAASTVHELARRYGREAMDKMRRRKDQLLANANTISEAWSNHSYGACGLKIAQ